MSSSSSSGLLEFSTEVIFCSDATSLFIGDSESFVVVVMPFSLPSFGGSLVSISIWFSIFDSEPFDVFLVDLVFSGEDLLFELVISLDPGLGFSSPVVSFCSVRFSVSMPVTPFGYCGEGFTFPGPDGSGGGGVFFKFDLPPRSRVDRLGIPPPLPLEDLRPPLPALSAAARSGPPPLPLPPEGLRPPLPVCNAAARSGPPLPLEDFRPPLPVCSAAARLKPAGPPPLALPLLAVPVETDAEVAV
mmetsp:Transcript_28949/g.35691  ORF Transcript_28949/g.35691 Transcript_28949/m.35691 type:complete len:245 (-) Transcript_28949:2794-3528(-)